MKNKIDLSHLRALRTQRIYVHRNSNDWQSFTGISQAPHLKTHESSSFKPFTKVTSPLGSVTSVVRVRVPPPAPKNLPGKPGRFSYKHSFNLSLPQITFFQAASPVSFSNKEVVVGIHFLFKRISHLDTAILGLDKPRGLCYMRPSDYDRVSGSVKRCPFFCNIIAAVGTKRPRCISVLFRACLKTENLTGSEEFSCCARHYFAVIPTYFRKKMPRRGAKACCPMLLVRAVAKRLCVL